MTEPRTPSPPKPPMRNASNATLALTLGLVALAGLGLLLWARNSPAVDQALARAQARMEEARAHPKPAPAEPGAPAPTASAEAPESKAEPKAESKAESKAEPKAAEPKAAAAERSAAKPETSLKTAATVVVRPPVPVKKVIPPYPPIAKAARIGGEVVIALKVNEKGVPVKATVLEGPPMLRSSALEAAKDWRFLPARSGSDPVPSDFKATFVYKI